MLKIIIIDDETHCRNVIRELLELDDRWLILAEAASVAEALEKIQIHKPDLVFLDIEMPDGTGFDLLEAFSKPAFQVIFTTGHNEYAIKAFKHSAIDYLLKPVDELELYAALNKAIAYRGAENTFEKLENMLKSMEQREFSKIAIPSMDSFEFVNKKEILFCESDSNYSRIFISDGRIILSTLTLKKLEEVLTESNFFRIHKSFIINTTFIKKVLKAEGSQVLMDNDALIPIARRRREDFFNLMGI